MKNQINVSKISDQMWDVQVVKIINETTAECRVYDITDKKGFPYECKQSDIVDITESAADLCGYKRGSLGGVIVSAEYSGGRYDVAVINDVRNRLGGKCPNERYM